MLPQGPHADWIIIAKNKKEINYIVKHLPNNATSRSQ